MDLILTLDLNRRWDIRRWDIRRWDMDSGKLTHSCLSCHSYDRSSPIGVTHSSHSFVWEMTTNCRISSRLIPNVHRWQERSSVSDGALPQLVTLQSLCEFLGRSMNFTGRLGSWVVTHADPVTRGRGGCSYRLAEAYPGLAVLGSRRRSDHHMMWWSGVASLSSQSG